MVMLNTLNILYGTSAACQPDPKAIRVLREVRLQVCVEGEAVKCRTP